MEDWGDASTTFSTTAAIENNGDNREWAGAKLFSLGGRG